MRHPISPASHRAAVAAWNAKVPIGSRVLALHEDGTKQETVTTSAAFTFVDSTSCVRLAGVPGAFPLHRVSSL